MHKIVTRPSGLRRILREEISHQNLAESQNEMHGNTETFTEKYKSSPVNWDSVFTLPFCYCIASNIDEKTEHRASQNNSPGLLYFKPQGVVFRAKMKKIIENDFKVLCTPFTNGDQRFWSSDRNGLECPGLLSVIYSQLRTILCSCLYTLPMYNLSLIGDRHLPGSSALILETGVTGIVFDLLSRSSVDKLTICNHV